jgi:hypothetical protein
MSQLFCHVFNNMIEMLTTRGFQSLPKQALVKWFGNRKYTGLGLNVLPPLYQGARLSAVTQHKYKQQLRDLPDSEIRSFIEHRENQIRDSCQRTEQCFTLPVEAASNYRKTFQRAICSLGFSISTHPNPDL